jgi:hypothetical protein
MRIDLVPAAVLALGLATPAGAQDAAPPDGPPPIIRASDGAMTCVQMSDEAAQLSARMGGEGESGVFGQVGGVAKAGAAMLIPGAGLLIAGADALTADERREREAEAAAVQDRWYYLNGLYAGRHCGAAASAPSSSQPPVRSAPAPGPAVPSPR